MSSIPCDVVILPSQHLAQQAISASKELVKLSSLFVLKDGRCYPHLSVYMCQLDTNNLSSVEQALKSISQSYSPLHLTTQGYGQSQGYIDADYQKTDELSRLQSDVIKALNPIRDGMREKDQARMKVATGLARQNYEKYGWKSVGDLYRPHMTLSRLRTDDPKAQKLIGDYKQFDGAFLKLGLFEMGDNGTAVRRIFECDL